MHCGTDVVYVADGHAIVITCEIEVSEPKAYGVRYLAAKKILQVMQTVMTWIKISPVMQR